MTTSKRSFGTNRPYVSVKPTLAPIATRSENILKTNRMSSSSPKTAASPVLAMIVVTTKTTTAPARISPKASFFVTRASVVQ